MDASQEAWLLLRSFLALVAVLALAVVSLRYGLPWLMRHRASGVARQLKVEEVLPLDRSHRLYVVTWEGRRLLIATSPGEVRLVAGSIAAGAEAGADDGGEHGGET
jgi:flagellar biogenesis protein FliO